MPKALGEGEELGGAGEAGVCPGLLGWSGGQRSWETSLCCPRASPDSGSKGLLQLVPGFLGPQGAGNDGQKPRLPEHRRRAEGWVDQDPQCQGWETQAWQG